MSRSSPERVVGATAVAASTGAVACAAACCTIPAIFPAILAAGFGGGLAWLAGGRFWVLGTAAGIVALAWVWLAWRSRGGGKTPRGTLVTMSVATLLLLTAVAQVLLDRFHPGMVMAALEAAG